MWKVVGAVAAVALLAGGSAEAARTTAPANTAPPTIAGNAREGDTLTASSGSWSGSTPITFSYRWQRCHSDGTSCSSIGSADHQTYQLRSGDVGRRLRVSVTASNSDGSANAVSGATAVVAKGQEPKNTALPTISGTPKDGQTLTATAGSWTNNPTSFDYQWRRCSPSGDDCRDVGSNRTTYLLGTGDVGSTIRARVKAKNQFGSNRVDSAQTGVVAPRGPVPGNTSLPTITGTPRDGQTLAANTGNWTNNPTRYAYQWLRCDSAGNNCATIGSGQTQRLVTADVGHTIRVTVSATNQYGTSKATSGSTALVATASSGTAIGVEQVSPPDRLVITSVKFFPRRLMSRTAFIGRFRVSDTRGRLVRGALVYAIGLPYGWVRNAPEVVTGGDGWATIQFFPTRLMPLHKAALVFFVRARKPGDSLLAGVSSRRLVQVGIG
jgi:hypothetical protein